MKTTLNLEDELIERAKIRAIKTRRTLTKIVEEALREYLKEETSREEYFRLKWEPVPGRLQAGVDPDDRDSLFDRMEGRG